MQELDRDLEKNLNKAMMKFNRMYERASTSKAVTQDEKQAVYNYGKNMVRLYPNRDNFFEEANGKLGALLLSLRINPPTRL